MQIKCAKNRMQLQIKKIVHIKKSHIHAQLWDINLVSRYEVLLLFYYCWWFIVLKNRLQFNSTKILTGYQWQANLFVAITVQTDLPKCYYQCNFIIRINKWFIIFRQNSFIKIAISHLVYRNIHRNGLGICSK